MKAAVRSYRANESAARDLISTTWNVLDRNLEGTASVINSLVDLLDDEDKKKSLLEAWNGFKVEVSFCRIVYNIILLISKRVPATAVSNETSSPRSHLWEPARNGLVSPGEGS